MSPSAPSPLSRGGDVKLEYFAEDMAQKQCQCLEGQCDTCLAGGRSLIAYSAVELVSPPFVMLSKGSPLLRVAAEGASVSENESFLQRGTYLAELCHCKVQ
jgi:hypothetical protein